MVMMEIQKVDIGMLPVISKEELIWLNIIMILVIL